MHRPHLYLALFALLFYQALSSAQVAGPKGDLIVIGKIDTIHSAILNEDRAVWIYVPESAGFPGKTYPVVYLLDGDAHFYSVMGLIQQLSTVNGNAVCPEMIVVGITNTNRWRDLTPTDDNRALGDTLFGVNTGGMVPFTSFIEKELMPYVESRYPVSPYKMYIGHSLGGLTVIHTLLTRPELFNAWIAIDPSLWWDDRYIAKMTDVLTDKKKFADESLYLAIANTMPAEMTIEQVNTDTSIETEHIRAILDFRDVSAKRMLSNGMDFQSKYYPDDDHGSLPLSAEIDGIKYLFSWYSLGARDLQKFIQKDSKYTGKELVETIHAHYEVVSEHFGYKVLPDEHMVNSLGYRFLEMKKRDLSFACFDMNVENYPQSSNVFDSMGDYFVAIGDVAKGVDFYKKALDVEEVPITREKYEALKNK